MHDFSFNHYREIMRAITIVPTTVKAYTKIDDHVHVARNCVIGRDNIITACAEISGSVEI